MKIGDKFKPNERFFNDFGCRELKRFVEKGLVLEVQRMPSRSGAFKYGFEWNGVNYGFNEEHVIPRKRQMENK